MAKILTIEDNVETQIILKRVLEKDHDLKICYDLTSARSYIHEIDFDLVLLDIHLPDGDGFTFFKELSFSKTASQIPVIIISSINDLNTKVLGLKSGADDYITKPFEYEDLKARVETVLRRGPARHNSSIINIFNLELDLLKQTVVFKSNEQLFEIDLTPIEFKILVTFCNSFEHYISREELKSIVWGSTYISLRNVDTHVCNLRKKIIGTKIDIMNKRGLGYIAKNSDQAIDAESNLKHLINDSFSLPRNLKINSSLVEKTAL
jgi:DNA-binding response OmpR family regulator